MIIIIGLGNPGKKYIKTRHNIGFRIIEEFAQKNSFPLFSEKFKCLVSESKGIILAKPQDFMNLSGKAVKLLVDYYKNKDIIVVHDDIDLLLGRIKVVRNRGSAGHKGVESIIKGIGKNFTRIRIGIQPHDKKPKSVDRFVLQKFGKEEEKLLEKTIKESIKILEEII